MSTSNDASLHARLDEARRLTRKRAWVSLAAAAAEMPDLADQSTELAYLYADAFWRIGQPETTLARAHLLETEVRRNGGDRLLLRVVNVIGMASFETGDLRNAEDCFSELLDLATERGDDEFAARASNNLGVLSNVTGDRDLALNFYQRALAAYQRLGHVRGLGQTHYNLAVTYRELGFPDRADSRLSTAIHFAQQSGSDDVVALAESERALIRLAAGETKLAATLAGRARERCISAGDPVRAAEAARVLALTYYTDRCLLESLELLDGCLATATEYANLLLRAEVQRDRGQVLAALGRSPEEAWNDARTSFLRLGSTHEAARVQKWLDLLL